MERVLKDIVEAPVILDREKYRSAVRVFGGFHDLVRRGGQVFSEERREADRIRMKKYWEDVRSGIRTRKPE